MPDSSTPPIETASPILSAVICTYNRAPLLDKVLKSLCRQTLPKGDFEVVVVNDGSTDDTEAIAVSYAPKLPLRYIYQRNAGLASGKNHGLFASRGEIVLFLDDDDVAAETLLEEHVKMHKKFPAEQYAVLGYTGLGEEVAENPLMHFVTEVGCFLFSYPSLKHADILDYTYFWGGRTSCKRSLLLEFGIFNPVFRFGCEDIELGYRLSRHGLRVVYNKNAISHTVRKISFDDFCRRTVSTGSSGYVFSKIHPELQIQRWTEADTADQYWTIIDGHYEAILNSARKLDSMANLWLGTGLEQDDDNISLLYQAYWAAFKACKTKGIIEKKRTFSETAMN